MTLVAGKKHCGPWILYIALGVVIVSLIFFSLHRSHALPVQPPPMHQDR
jgi:hypothetical protein